MSFRSLTIFFRAYKKNKVVTTINIAGLTIGLLSALFIFEYVFFERSFDDYHKNVNQVYRVVYNRYQDEKLQWETANCYFPTGKWLKDNYSEVLDWAIVSRKYNITVTYKNPVGDKVFFNEEKSYYAGSSIFNLFTIPLVEGKKTCLDEPNTVAVSQRAAKKYFGNENPLGKLLTINNTEEYTVKGVYYNIPANSHLQTDFLFSLPTYTSQNQWIFTNWGYDYFHTYIMLAPDTDYKEFCSRAMPDMVTRNYAAKLKSTNSRDEFFFQPLQDIHLNSNIEYETEPPGNSRITNILFGFAIFLLVIAWINYVNLVTAQSLDRAKEMGIKKINGARKIALAGQFISEAFILNTICLIITLALFLILNPLFKSITNISDFNLFRYGSFVFAGLLVFLSGVLLSSIYPAIVLSSYKPATILTGKFKNSAEGLLFRKGLVTTQFIISIGLLIGTIITFNQASFLMKKDMGVNYNAGLIIRTPRDGKDTKTRINKLQLLKDKVLKLSEVKDFTLTSDIPGEEINHWMFGRRKGFDGNDGKAYFQIGVDDRFVEFYDVKVLAGRKFHKDEATNLHTVLMNKKAIERFGYPNPEDAVDEIFVTGNNQEWRVVGVVDDFHYKSIKTEPVPTIITLNDGIKQFINLKINNTSAEVYASLLPQLRSEYQSVFNDQPFEYFLLDDKMRLDLEPDNTFASVFILFSGLAVFIAVIGIVGLILITIKQNLKELGIRKALGAQIGDLSRLLSKQLLLQFVIALTAAIPLSYFGYKKWFLDTYIYKIDMSSWFFIGPVLLMFGIILAVILALSASVYNMKTAEVLQNE